MENERVKKDLTHTWQKELKKLVCEVSYACVQVFACRVQHDSCLMVFTMYGICTALGLCVLPRAEPQEVHTARGWYYPMHCKNHETAAFTDRPYKG